MPAPYLQKVHKETGISMHSLESKWSDAKEKAKEPGKELNYGIVLTIFKKMIGIKS